MQMLADNMKAMPGVLRWPVSN